jgi:hypothetical protein
MSSTDPGIALPAGDVELPRTSGRVRHTLVGWRPLAGTAYRDPEHVTVRLALYGADRLGESTSMTGTPVIVSVALPHQVERDLVRRPDSKLR